MIKLHQIYLNGHTNWIINKVKSLNLADPKYNNPQTINLLIGTDLYCVSRVITGSKTDMGNPFPNSVEKCLVIC